MRFVIQPLTVQEHKTFYYNKFIRKFNEEETPERTHIIIWNMNSVRERVSGITPETIEIFLDFCSIIYNENSYNFFLCCLQEYDYDFGKYIDDGEFVEDLKRCIDEDEPDEKDKIVKELIKRVLRLEVKHHYNI